MGTLRHAGTASRGARRVDRWAGEMEARLLVHEPEKHDFPPGDCRNEGEKLSEKPPDVVKDRDGQPSDGGNNNTGEEGERRPAEDADH